MEIAIPKVATARYSSRSRMVATPTTAAAAPAAIIPPASPTTKGSSNPPATASREGPIRIAVA